MQVVILSGGSGSRLSEEKFLKPKPKPMIEIGGRPYVSSGTEKIEGQLLINLVNFKVIIVIFMNILCISRSINEMQG